MKTERENLFDSLKNRVSKEPKVVVQKDETVDLMDELRMRGREVFGHMSERDMSTQLLIMEIKIEELIRENMLLKQRLEELTGKKY